MRPQGASCLFNLNANYLYAIHYLLTATLTIPVEEIIASAVSKARKRNKLQSVSFSTDYKNYNRIRVHGVMVNGLKGLR